MTLVRFFSPRGSCKELESRYGLMQLHRRVIEVEFTSYFKPAIYQSVAACTVNPFAGDCPKGTAAAQRNAEAETHHPNETVCLDSHPQASKLLNALRCEDSYTRNEKHSMKYGSINWSSEISAVCNCSIFFSTARPTYFVVFWIGPKPQPPSLGVACCAMYFDPGVLDEAHHILFHHSPGCFQSSF